MTYVEKLSKKSQDFFARRIREVQVESRVMVKEQGFAPNIDGIDAWCASTGKSRADLWEAAEQRILARSRTEFDAKDYAQLYDLFNSGYAGYKPTVKEIPNGDGVIDTDKRYLHVALKYDPPAWAMAYFFRALERAVTICRTAGLPEEFWPVSSESALRVLDYPPHAGSAPHTDFDLITLNCYRSTPDCIPATSVHFGELAELIGWMPATSHRVIATPYSQHSIVFFALPARDVRLPNGLRMGAWLDARIARSRIEAK